MRKLGLDDAVTLTRQRHGRPAIAYYRGSTAFLTLSDHEGFCVHLLEAMRSDLPVVAHAAAAIPETLGDDGILVGAFRDQPQVHARVVALVERLGLGGAVWFVASVDDASLLAYHRAATAFVSLSEHEGFGVPLLEAIRFRLPVVAYDAAAIGQTVGDAGVLPRERDLAETAEAAAMVGERTDLREAHVAAGERRVNDFDPEKVADRMRQMLGL